MKKIEKAMKNVGLLFKFLFFLPLSGLLTIYKSSIRPQLNYGYVIYGQPSNESFFNKIEFVKYNVAPASTGVLRGFSREKNLPGIRARDSI